jgi:hypothetical protein
MNTDHRDKTAIWAIVSSDEQNDPNCTSVELQIERDRRDAEQSGDIIVAVLQPPKDTGCSRFYDSLEEMMDVYPPYRQLVELIQSRAITKVIAYNYSRYWRARTLGTQLIALAELYDVWLRSVEEPYTREMWMENAWLQTIHLTMPEVQIRQLASDRRRGMQKRAERGLPVGGRSPFGYRMVGNGKDRQLVPDSAQRDTVRLLMEWRAQGWGSSRAEREAARLGLTGAKGGSLCQESIRTIWHNPIYAGYTRARLWPRRPKSPRRGEPIVAIGRGRHEPLISEELWQRVQQVNESQARDYAPRGDTPHLLTGLLRCGWCGRHMRYHAHSDNKLRYSLTCLNDACKNVCSARKLHRQVLDWLRQALTDPDAWLRQYQQNEGTSQEGQRLAALVGELAGVERKRANLLAAIEEASGAANRRQIVERYDALGEQGERLQTEIAALQQSAARMAVVRERLMAWSELAPRLDTLLDAELRAMLLQLVNRIVVTKGQLPGIALAGTPLP